MARVTKYLVIGLLVYFVNSVCVQESLESTLDKLVDKKKKEENILRYKVEIISTYTLEPKGTKIKKISTLDAYLQPVSILGNIVSVAFKNVNVIVQKEFVYSTEYIELSKCFADTITATDLERPFLISYDAAGVLRNIKLGRDETSVSVNLKLLGASILQFNILQILGIAPKITQRRELTLEGTCLVKEETKRSWDDTFFLGKVYNVAKCSEVKKSYNENAAMTCLGNTCNRRSAKQLTWTAEDIIEIQMADKKFIARKANIKQQMSYKPYKDQDIKFHAEMEFNVELVSFDLPLTGIHSRGSFVVKKPVRKPVDNHICNARNDTISISDLRLFYSAMECEPSFSALYGVLIESAIECDYQS